MASAPCPIAGSDSARRQRGGDAGAVTEALEARAGEHDRVELAGVDLAQRACRRCRATARRRDRAGARLSWQTRRKLEVPTRAPLGSDATSCAGIAGRPAARRAGPRARGRAPSTRPTGHLGRQILHRVHRDLGAPVEQRLLDLLDEEPLAADLGERAVEDLVAARLQHQQLDGELRVVAPSADRAPSWPATAPAPIRASRFDHFAAFLLTSSGRRRGRRGSLRCGRCAGRTARAPAPAARCPDDRPLRA